MEGRISDSAKGLLAELEGELAPEVYTEALERDQKLESDNVVTHLIGT